ncbi:hypothetical protein FD01_GL000587 [Lacticaseibacillus manihotivorans DSM 13343 = JCM 12514]|uniref:Uncharacterized protein n=2 Tax=Lacticaseibacillus manihotivorans TaxID=88233 RepID=A0A0R1RAF5_9LACO|nr:hypothetical protein FD01_GL000587 [Lacticaseibacillus manihotivorans DSM 13343 = JCM 12514]
MALSYDDLKQAFYKRLLSSTPQRFAGMLGGATAGNFIRIDPKTRMVECIR